MTLDDFINLYTGLYVDFDKIYPNQCMDLVHLYKYICLGIHDKTTLSAPTAAQVWNLNYPQLFDKIVNAPNNCPLRGDIIIWGTKIGPAGHIGIVNNANVNSLESFDANWPVGSNPHLVEHNYTGVLGWLRFKGNLPSGENLENMALQISELKSSLNTLQAKYNELEDKYAKDMAEKQLHIESLQKTGAEATSQLILARQAVESAKQTLEAKEEACRLLEEKVGEMTRERDMNLMNITHLADQLSDANGQVVTLQKKLKEGLKSYGKWELFLELFRK